MAQNETTVKIDLQKEWQNKSDSTKKSILVIIDEATFTNMSTAFGQKFFQYSACFLPCSSHYALMNVTKLKGEVRRIFFIGSKFLSAPN